MSEKLEILILAKDQASGELKKVGASTSALGGTINALVMGGGLALFAAGLKDCVAGAVEAEAIQADLNAVLKSTQSVAGVTADEVNRLAKEFQNTTKFEDDTIVKGEAMLLTFTKIGKDTFPAATQAMLDMSQKFGMDVPQAAITLGKALNDPVAGVTALRRIGVMLTDEQKDMIKSFVDVGDIASAQKIILAELSIEIGGVSQAYGSTAGGSMAIFQNKVNGIKDAIGAGLLPTLTDLLGKVSGLGAGLTDNTQKWTDVTAAITTFMATPLGDALTTGTETMKALNSVLDTAGKLLKSLGIGQSTTEVNLWSVALNKSVDILKVLTGGPLSWFKAGLDGIKNVIAEIKALNLADALADLHRLGVPGFQSGGIVPGPVGAPMLAVVHGGEMITPASQVQHHYNLTINSRSAVEPLIGDFHMMKSLAGV